MVKGIIYNPNVEELAKEQSGYMERLWKFNQLKPSEGDKKVKYMKETFAECGDIYVGDKVMFCAKSANTTASIFTGTKKSTGRISNKSGQISKI